MKRVLLAAVGAASLMLVGSSAFAAGGCGPGFHRGPLGGCRPNLGAGPVVGVPAIGVFTPGRGYWDGHRYWGHRYRFGNGWRYR